MAASCVTLKISVKMFGWMLLQDEKVHLLRTCSSMKYSLGSCGYHNIWNYFSPPLCPKRGSLCRKLYGCNGGCWRYSYCVEGTIKVASVRASAVPPPPFPTKGRLILAIFSQDNYSLYCPSFILPWYHQFCRSYHACDPMTTLIGERHKNTVRQLSPTRQKFQGNLILLHFYFKNDPLANYSSF